MSEENERKDAPASGRKPLTLTRTTAGGTVKQSFSHGRSKSVVVEMKQRRTIGPGGAPGAAPAPAAPGVPPPRAAAPAAAAPASTPAPKPQPPAAGRGGLSEDESRRRVEAVSRAQADEQVRRERMRVEEEQRRALEDAQRRMMDEEQAAADARRRKPAHRAPPPLFRLTPRRWKTAPIFSANLAAA